MGVKLAERDSERAALELRQTAELKATSDETEKALLGAKHADELELFNVRWESDLGNVRDTQRREFREWVTCVHGEINVEGGLPKSGSRMGLGSFSIGSPSESSLLQESFTITLGAQMKQMHNLRLVAAEPADTCAFKWEEESFLPQRLQTSMSLYSNDLSGLLVMVRDKIDPGAGYVKVMSELCARSPESHFPSYPDQLDRIKEERARDSGSGGGSGGFNLGDVFVTRHSNLCDVHVLFHMFVDDSVASSSINSRNPALMGLRNVLKTASLSDVTKVALPLLLTMDMTEEMTVQWCLKRAELVFKCVKGFMVEVSSWGGSEIKTLDFLVPKNIDREVFNRLAGILSGIFRTSNPIRAK